MTMPMAMFTPAPGVGAMPQYGVSGEIAELLALHQQIMPGVPLLPVQQSMLQLLQQLLSPPIAQQYPLLAMQTQQILAELRQMAYSIAQNPQLVQHLRQVGQHVGQALGPQYQQAPQQLC